MRPFRRSESFSLIIEAGSTASRYTFGDIPQLRSDVEKDVLVRSIQVYPAEVLPNDFNGVAVATLAQLQQAFLTLYIEDAESVHYFPLIDLVNNYGVTVSPLLWTSEITQFENIRVDWVKSYISFPTSFNPGVQTSFVFKVGYKKVKAGTLELVNDQNGNPTWPRTDFVGTFH